MQIFEPDHELESNLDEFRFFNYPDVRLIAKSEVLFENLDDLGEYRGFDIRSDGSDSCDILPEIGGRLCYLAFNKRRPATNDRTQNQTYLDHIMEVGHGSVLEHSTWSFLVSDVSRNYTHEQVRHRVGTAYSQLSTRYVDQFDNNYFNTDKTLGALMPLEIKDDKELKIAYKLAWEKCQESYLLTFNKLRLLGYDLKRARSIARHILPGSAGTMILITVNARELDHIFKLRGSLFADDEIRRVVIEMYRLVKDTNLFRYWDVEVDNQRAHLINLFKGDI